MIDEDETTSRTAAQSWWQLPNPPSPLTRTPSGTTPPPLSSSPARSHPLEMRWPNANGPLLVALFGLLFSPLGIVACLWADSQTRAMDAGAMYNERRGTLAFAKVLGAIETILLFTVALIAIGR